MSHDGNDPVQSRDQDRYDNHAEYQFTVVSITAKSVNNTKKNP